MPFSSLFVSCYFFEWEILPLSNLHNASINRFELLTVFGRSVSGWLVRFESIIFMRQIWNEMKRKRRQYELKTQNNNKIIYIVNYLKMVLRLNLKKNLYCKIFSLFRPFSLSVSLFWRLAESLRCAHLCLTKKFINCVHPVCSQLLDSQTYKKYFHIRNATMLSQTISASIKRNPRKLLLSKP